MSAPRVVVIYSPAVAGARAAETDLSEAVAALLAALPGARAVAIERPEQLLALGEVDVVFNACEAPGGRPELEAAVPALLAWRGVACTGAGVETLTLCRRKDLARAVLSAAGVPVPPSEGLPCVVKPADEDGSYGLDGASLCFTEAERDAAMARLSHPLVERFLPGRELPVALWGTQALAGEVRFRGQTRLITYAAKWDPDSVDWHDTPVVYPSPAPAELVEAAVDVARRAWAAVGGSGYGRVDVRFDEQDRPYVIDVNPNPDISPDGGLAKAVAAAGWTWADFVRHEVEDALRRHGRVG